MKCDISSAILEKEFLASSDFGQKSAEAVEQIHQTVMNVCADPKSIELKESLKTLG